MVIMMQALIGLHAVGLNCTPYSRLHFWFSSSAASYRSKSSGQESNTNWIRLFRPRRMGSAYATRTMMQAFPPWHSELGRPVDDDD